MTGVPKFDHLFLSWFITEDAEIIPSDIEQKEDARALLLGTSRGYIDYTFLEHAVKKAKNFKHYQLASLLEQYILIAQIPQNTNPQKTSRI